MNNIIATEETKTAGAISYWRLGGETSLAKLTLEWQAVGLDPNLLPGNPSAEVCLRRAVGAVESPTRKSLKIRGGDFQGGWALVEIDTTDGHVKTQEILRAKIEGAATRIECFGEELANIVLDRFAALRVELAATDISAWLTKLAKDKGTATSLRESGGVYFVPRAQVEFWSKVAQALQASGAHKVFRIPAMRSEEAVAAILDAVEQEAAKLVQEVEADLEDDKLGSRALDSRKERCDAMLAKIRTYEQLLGVKMVALQGKVEGLAVNVVAASLAA